MSDGKGCECHAHYAGECGCDGVDWTPQELVDMKAELAALKKDARELAENVQRLSCYNKDLYDLAGSILAATEEE